MLVAAVVVGLVVGALAAGSSKAPLRSVSRSRRRTATRPGADPRRRGRRLRPPARPRVGQIEDDRRCRQRPLAREDLLAGGREGASVHAEDAAGGAGQPRLDYRGKAVPLEFFATWCPHCAPKRRTCARSPRRCPAPAYDFSRSTARRRCGERLRVPRLLRPPVSGGRSTRTRTLATSSVEHGSPGTVSKALPVSAYSRRSTSSTRRA